MGAQVVVREIQFLVRGPVVAEKRQAARRPGGVRVPVPIRAGGRDPDGSRAVSKQHGPHAPGPEADGEATEGAEIHQRGNAPHHARQHKQAMPSTFGSRPAAANRCPTVRESQRCASRAVTARSRSMPYSGSLFMRAAVSSSGAGAAGASRTRSTGSSTKAGPSSKAAWRFAVGDRALSARSIASMAASRWGPDGTKNKNHARNSSNAASGAPQRTAPASRTPPAKTAQLMAGGPSARIVREERGVARRRSRGPVTARR